MVRRGHGIDRLARRLGRLRGGRLGEDRGEDRGAVAAEYGLLLALVALAIIVAVTAFGLALLRLFQAGVDAFP